MARLEDNTVNSKDQISKKDSVIKKQGTGTKVLFVGNSITLHGVAPHIGWNNHWGMAASALENDYVHLTMEHIKTVDPDASFMIAQIANWEREYWKPEILTENYKEAIDFEADIIIIRVIENIKLVPEHDLKNNFEKMIDIFNSHNKAKILITSPFWPDLAKGAVLEEIAKERNLPFVDITIGGDDKYTAKGLFEHKGVASHPGDEGMKEIARLIFESVKNII